VPPSALAPLAKPPSGWHLPPAERKELAPWRAQGHEVRRNAEACSGGPEYRATTAQWDVTRAARRPLPAKLAVNAALRR